MDTSLPGPVDYQLWIVNHHSATSSKEVEARALFDHSTHSSWGCPGFLMRDKASSPAAGFIQNGSLLVGVNISLPHHKDQLHLSHNCSMDNTFKLQSTLCDGIKTIYEDDQMSDFTIKAGDTVIHAHKVVLAAHSASFKAMFQSEMQEAHDSTVELGDIEGPVLELLISAMYGDYSLDPPELLVPLFVAADAHQVEAVRAICLKQLINNVSIDTALHHYSTADSCTEPTLRDACTSFMALSKNSQAARIATNDARGSRAGTTVMVSYCSKAQCKAVGLSRFANYGRRGHIFALIPSQDWQLL